MKHLLKTFPNRKFDANIVKAKDIFVYTNKNKKLMDMTGGFTGHAILGWGVKKIEQAIQTQLKKVPHIDYKVYGDENREKLSKILTKNISINLNKVFLVGGSGSEACEAAMKLSYQAHHDNGKEKKRIFLSRKQSYHGSTIAVTSLGDRPNLLFYKNLHDKTNFKIQEHNKYRHKKKNETDLEYSHRSAKDLEIKIKKIGPENISGFVGETMLGGLIGDVPPTKYYWKLVRKICDKYDIHLIIDEVWCGTGTSGKYHCIEWDSVTPDFLFICKTLAAGYMPISAVLTTTKIENIIKRGQKQIQYSNTFQGHSVACAAALEVQKIINQTEFLKRVNKLGYYFRNNLETLLKDNDFFLNVRGRGLRNSLEYNCDEKNLFGIELANIMLEDHNIIISGKWHRVCFSQSLNIKKKELDLFLDKFSKTFKKIQSKWTKKYYRNILPKAFY